MAATLGAGQRERVIELFDELKAGDDCEPDATSYATAMSTHVELESPERALELYDDFVASAAEPRADVVTAAVTACDRVGEWDRAAAIFDEANARGVVPDPALYAAMLRVCEEDAKAERALALLS
jgi:pentatricopeptide repeat domain-containing protein 1